MSYLNDKLIPEWRVALKLRTVQIAIVFGTAMAVWSELPEGLQLMALNSLGISGQGLLATLGFASFIYARLAAQPKIGFDTRIPFLDALKHYLSVQLAAVLTVATPAWFILPADTQQAIMDFIGPGVTRWIGVAAFLSLVFARLKAQGGTINNTDPALAKSDTSDNAGDKPSV